MLVSGREAAAILAGAGLAREQARRLLLAGFAGEGQRVRGAMLYDAGQVRALVKSPPVSSEEFTGSCPSGAFVLRTWRGMHLGATHEEQMSRLRLSWRMSPWARALLLMMVAEQGYFPFLATVSGFVAAAGDITGLSVPTVSPDCAADEVTRPRTVTLVVDEPGDWCVGLAGRRLDTGRGGPWVLWATRGSTS